MKILTLFAVLAGFICVHLIKLMRMYLIVMEEKVSFDRFVPAYLRTTLINLIIPYKLGEIYRVIVFYRISGGFKTGFFAVLIDRFFDTLALVAILLPYQLMRGGEVSAPTMLLFAFVAVILIAYRVFSPSYAFLNRYIITSRQSKRSLGALAALEVLNGWYEYVRNLVTGRYGILFLFSLAAWLLEMGVLAGFAKLMGEDFTVARFGTYIESIVSGKDLAVKTGYTIYSAVVMFALTVIFTSIYLIRRQKEAAGSKREGMMR